MDFALFLQIVGQINEYHSFTRDKLAELLSKLGDLHYKAAITFLDRSKTSNDPAGEIRSAITALGIAYEHFWKTVSQDDLVLFFKRSVPYVGELNQYTYEQACRRACESALLLAVLYLSKQDRTPAKECIANARKCFKKYEDCSVAWRPFNLESVLLRKLSGIDRQVKERVKRESSEFDAACRRLERGVGA